MQIPVPQRMLLCLSFSNCSHVLTIPMSAGQIESNYDETVDSFDTMNLKSELLRGMQMKHSNAVW